MKASKCWGALLLALTVSLLSACGGGGGDSQSEVMGAQQQPAITLELANAVMDVWQTRSPGDFAPTGVTTELRAPFAQRYYPATDTYLRVVVSADADYALAGVYASGGHFGPKPVLLGQASSFVRLPDLAATEHDNQCFSLENRVTPGTQSRVVSEMNSNHDYTRTSERVIKSGTFAGQPLIEMQHTVTPSVGIGTTASFFVRATAPGELTEYGYVAKSYLAASTGTFVPPFVNHQFRLRPGESQYKTRTTRMSSGVPAGDYTVEKRELVTLVGYETITVPAGSFQTCKVEITTHETATSNGASRAAPSLTTNWYIVGSGIIVKSTYQNFSPSGAASKPMSEEAISIEFNGRPL